MTCQQTFTACTAKCGSPSNSECQQACFSAITSCSLGCAGV
jgi:hypothetical protein